MKEIDLSKVKKWEYNEKGERGITCNSCKTFKTEDNFNKRSTSYLGIRSECRECTTKENEALRKTKEGIIQTMYDSQKSSCKTRGMVQPKYTKDEFFKWCISQEVFHILYQGWVDSEYNMYSKPSVDRIDNFKTYSFDNIRIMTWKENKLLGHKAYVEGNTIFGYRSVSQYDLDGNFIKDFISSREAQREHNISYQNILKCCNSERKTAGGFTWKYAEKGGNQK